MPAITCYKTFTCLHFLRTILTRSTIPCACHAKRHPNVQRWREHVVSLTCWLRNVLRATTACTFSTSQLPKVVRSWCVLYILTWKCASRHNGVHFFDIWTWGAVIFFTYTNQMCSAPQRCAPFRHFNFQKWSAREAFLTFSLANVLRATTACNFSFLIWPDGSAPAALASLLFDPLGPQIIGKTRLSYLFAHLHLLSSDSFSSLIFSRLLFSSLFFCFSSVHTVGSLTSKLPSIKLINILYLMYMCMYTTSSTAQGGGGSFKNRKPIGEVGCCESRMAERIRWWTERWLKLCFLEWLQWLQWSHHPQLLYVVLQCNCCPVV